MMQVWKIYAILDKSYICNVHFIKNRKKRKNIDETHQEALAGIMICYVCDAPLPLSFCKISFVRQVLKCCSVVIAVKKHNS